MKMSVIFDHIHQYKEGRVTDGTKKPLQKDYVQVPNISTYLQSIIYQQMIGQTYSMI